MIIVLLADGFEEIEALTTVDLLRRAKLDVKTVGMNGRVVCGSHNIPVICDLLPEEVKLEDVTLAVFPGGMPGAKNLDSHKFTDKVILSLLTNGGRLAAICAAPMIFGKRGILAGKKATCYPGFENELKDAEIIGAPVVTDGIFTTASGMGSSIEFAEELLYLMVGKKKAEDISKSIKSLPNTAEKGAAEKEPTEVFVPILTEPVIEEKEEPVFDLLAYPKEIQDTAAKILSTLSSFGVKAILKGVDIGPRIIRYEITPAKGQKVSTILNLADDIALATVTRELFIEAPIPGKSAIGIHIPKKKPDTVKLSDLMETKDFKALNSPTAACLGLDVAGSPVFADVAKMPHALITGATGMGKSMVVNTLIASVLNKSTPEQVKLILIDTKQVEFVSYNDIPELLVPIITDSSRAIAALLWACAEMERRYSILQEQSVRNIDAYNEKTEQYPEIGTPLRKIIIVIDELAELMVKNKKVVETAIIRIVQKARAAGIYMIIGTQRPRKEIITGLIKSNVPTKISCKLVSSRDSVLVFDSYGAEKLLDKGDMMVSLSNSIKPLRVQAPFVSDNDVEEIAKKMKETYGLAKYDDFVISQINAEYDKLILKNILVEKPDFSEENENYLKNPEFKQAARIAVATGKISTAIIQRKLSIGYGKAARFIDAMEELGIISKPCGEKPREVLINELGLESLIEKAEEN